jgi:hypothetical protein
MVEVTRAEYPLNPTLKLVTPEGRATAEFFRVLKAIGDLISNITIEDGEVTADMISVVSLEAISATLGNVVIDGDLVVNGTITTGKVAQNAITEVTAAAQVSPVGPSGQTVVGVAVPVTTTGNTGVLITFNGFMSLPTPDPANFGTWGLYLTRNGVIIDSTAALYYDDNFTYPVTAAFIDDAPGLNPSYEIVTFLGSGLGNFQLAEGLIICSLLKR